MNPAIGCRVIRAFAVACASACLAATAAAQVTPQGQGPIPGAQGTMDLTFLQGELGNWGEWGRLDPWGPVWRPRGTPSWWQPYTRGHWNWCYPGGVLWQGDEQWSWLTDHYGRWNFDQQDGWYWIPDDEWAPAWVCWAGCGQYVGWAPLPPEQGDQSGAAGDGTDAGAAGAAAAAAAADSPPTVPSNAMGLCMIEAWKWNFVQGQRLSSGEVAQLIVPRASNAKMLAYSVPLTNFTHEQGILACQPFTLEMIRQVPGWSIPAPPATFVDNPMQGRQTTVNGMVPIFMPVFTGSTLPVQEHFNRNVPHRPSTLPDDGVNSPYVAEPLTQWNPTAPAVPQVPWEPYAPIAPIISQAQPAGPVQRAQPVQPHQPVQPAQPVAPQTQMQNYLQERQQMEAFHHGQMQRLQLWQDQFQQNLPLPLSDDEIAQWQAYERAEYMRQVGRQRDVVDGRYDGDSPFGLMQWGNVIPPNINTRFGPGGGGAAGRR